ncbi:MULTISPECIES: DUF4114 domain-containing protein [unclassified Coleofasciculus]|uniref:DUF4114 domain-containing protein n=1 Tax=unclassified Coleofasciculus TaxID=2692782 RepID=UPI0018811BD6|nr:MULTISPECIES: DUF4114 domain-containing protein [unclassified Coleofasciculus]MBE9126887.1 DUF4114 domain-containing protein [Coleofasciculus sp. LEGE 07081]MBE9150217.1 DUF4114 domain-containing protein [Coleofasciculus sp. LEGE 07092]
MATHTVTTKADSGTGSLRAAIAIAQAGDRIKFDSSLANKTIQLTSGQLGIDKNLIIDGKQASGLTISGNNASRVFFIQGDPPWVPVDVTLKNLIIANGKTNGKGEDGAGAGLWTESYTKLTLENTEFKNNHANGEGGGAIFAGWRSTNTVINSKFEGNSSSGNGTSGKSERGGGAIAVKSESSTTVEDSEFTGNSGINGGAINTLLGGLKVENSTFVKNDSTPGGSIGPHTMGYGGAIYTDGASATTGSSTSGKIEIRDSRFDGNTGAGQGGALFLFAYAGDKVMIENSTIINNQVVKDVKGDALGGGLRHGNSELIVRNTTFAYNQALVQGGGLWVGETSPVTIDNSTFYGNKAESTDGKSGLGGAILLANGSNPTKISNTTIAENYAGFQGGGFWGGGSSTTLKNTLVADNFANNGGNNWNIFHHTGKIFSDGGGNFQSFEPNPNDTKITAGAKLIDPKLVGSFEDNGSAVQTPPLSGNPLVTGGAKPIALLGGVKGLSDNNRSNTDTDNSISTTLPILSKSEEDVFLVEGNPGFVQLQFNLIESKTDIVNEVGFFIVDNNSGSVNGIAPSEEGYLEAAMSQSQVIFSALPSDEFPNLSFTRQLSLEVGQKIGFYLVQNSTTDAVLSDLAAGRTPAPVFFAPPSANGDGFDHLQVSELSNNTFNLAWEDTVGENSADFNDLVLSVQVTNDNQVPGTQIQGGQAGEVMELRDNLTGLVPAEFVVNSKAIYDNTFGFYIVDNVTGRIGNLNPGAPGYAEAAISQRLDLEAGLPAGKIIAPFLIADGTAEEFLAENPNNQYGQGVQAYFVYLGANPDGKDHVRLLGDNTFAFEDKLDGGDLDYNDLIVEVSLG